MGRPRFGRMAVTSSSASSSTASGEPLRHGSLERQAPNRFLSKSEDYEIAEENEQRSAEAFGDWNGAERCRNATERNPERNESAENHHPSMESDEAGHDGAQSEQRREVEQIRTDDNARANLPLVL